MDQRWTNHRGEELTARVPANVEPFVRLVGADNTVKLILALGGAQVYLPKQIGGKSGAKLVDLIGRDAAVRLCRVHGSRVERFPLSPVFVARHLKGQGAAISEIARVLHRSDKTIRGYLRIQDAHSPRARCMKMEDRP
jgi:hypothetical protein